jgi:hypothetical protein
VPQFSNYIKLINQSVSKRPDSLKLVPWHAGRSVVWDVTVIYSLATSYLASTSVTPAGAAKIAATRKEAKYFNNNNNNNLISRVQTVSKS